MIDVQNETRFGKNKSKSKINNKYIGYTGWDILHDRRFMFQSNFNLSAIINLKLLFLILVLNLLLLINKNYIELNMKLLSYIFIIKLIAHYNIFKDQ